MDQERGYNWSHPVATGLNPGSPAHGDLESRQQCRMPFLGQATHLRRPAFPVHGFIVGQQGLGTASDKAVIADGAQIWFLMVIGPQSQDTDLSVGGTRTGSDPPENLKWLTLSSVGGWG